MNLYEDTSTLTTNSISLVAIFLFSTVCSTVSAQIINTEISLTITSDEFQDGISAGEAGDVNINITNLGPNPINSTDNLGVIIGYNVTQNTDLFFDFVLSPTNDPNCNFVFPIASPRPPVNDILFFFYYEITADIEVGATYTCTISATFDQPGVLETVWRMYYLSGNDTEIIDYPFIFRGQPLPVPINLKLFLITAFLLIGGLFLKNE